MRVVIFISLLIFMSCKNHEKVSKADWHLSDSFVHVSKFLLQQNKLDSAEILIERSIQLDPSNYEAFNNQAYLRNMQKRSSKEVIADYEKALEINPFYDVATYSLANYYHSIKDWENTIKWTDRYFGLSKRKETDSLINNIYRIREDAEKYFDQSN
jgi:tetratricopeptide (TPR) repeat protein